MTPEILVTFAKGIAIGAVIATTVFWTEELWRKFRRWLD